MPGDTRGQIPAHVPFLEGWHLPKAHLNCRKSHKGTDGAGAGFKPGWLGAGLSVS